MNRFFILWVLIFAGCGTSEPSRFYLLSPIDAAPVIQDTQKALGIEIRPVETPQYLNRLQIVTRQEQNRIHVAEFDRWAEPLDRSMARVLIENLSHLLASDRVVCYPERAEFDPDFRVSLKVLQFDGALNQSMILRARWSLFKGDKPLYVGKFHWSKPIGESYDEMVQCGNQALLELCRKIALKISNPPPT